jgi:hypothetical protein
MPHSNQDTQVSIESYHGTLRHLLSLERKGFKGCQIDWLVWKLITTIARHYMHTFKMKKGFIENKVVECIMETSVEKSTLISQAHMYPNHPLKQMVTRV